MQCCLEPFCQHFTRFLPVKCCSKSIRTTLNRVFSVKCCLEPLGQHCKRFLPAMQCCPKSIWTTLNRTFSVQCCLEPLGQHCTRFLTVVQCCPKSFWTTLKRIFSEQCCWSLLDNIAQGFDLCNGGPWLTDTFYEVNKLYNVVSIMLGQHCIGILFSKCCPNMCEIKLHKKINYLCNDSGPDHTGMFLQENNLYNVVLICLCQCWIRELLMQYAMGRQN